MKKLLTVVAVLLPLVASAQYEPVPAQPGYAPAPGGGPAAPYSRRSPWYIGFGFGTGSGNVSGQGVSVTLDEWNEAFWYNPPSPTDFSFNFKIGATLSDKLLVGFDVSSVMSMISSGDASSTVGIVNYDAVATYFPMGEGVFVRGGVGVSRLSVSLDDPVYGTATENWSGFNALVGAGYAFWIGQTFNLTLNLDYSLQSYGSSDTDPESSNFFTAWVGFDWY